MEDTFKTGRMVPAAFSRLSVAAARNGFTKTELLSALCMLSADENGVLLNSDAVCYLIEVDREKRAKARMAENAAKELASIP